ncbi:MAG: DNA-processing protein DprA [Paludibacteraceae bacterium]|nr:DNA-processing protein DprA [Paludibacteraceae bacterium]
MNSEILYQIALTMAKGVGVQTIRRLVSAIGSEKEVFQCPMKELEEIPGIGAVIAKSIKDPQLLKRAEKEIRFLQRTGAEAIPFGSDEYPQRMKECVDAPYILYTKGKMMLNGGHFIGIVGTRKMSPYGKSVCEEIVTSLAKKYPDLSVISGLAYGVDGCAHKKAVELGIQTIGVVGHGLDMIYPARHRALSNKMMERGGIVTEFRSECIVDKKNFVSRNRIIAGMCDVILVVESGEKGGALFTAEFANSYNKDVCAIPGRIGDLYSAGCNKLIKNNQATMVESAEEIEQLMNWDIKEKEHSAMNISRFMQLTEQERIVVEALQMESRMDMNQLVRKTAIPFSQLSSLLFDMEMKDIVCSAPGNIYFLPRH